MYKELLLFYIPPCFYAPVTIPLPGLNLRIMIRPQHSIFSIPSSRLDDEDLLHAPPTPQHLLRRPLILHPVNTSQKSHKGSDNKIAARKTKSRKERKSSLLQNDNGLSAIEEEDIETERAYGEGTSNLSI
jgi:hypothetical protein